MRVQQCRIDFARNDNRHVQGAAGLIPDKMMVGYECVNRNATSVADSKVDSDAIQSFDP